MPLFENLPQTTDSNLVLVAGSFNTNTTSDVTLPTGFGITSITDSAAGVYDTVLAEKYPYLVSCVCMLGASGAGDFYVDNTAVGVWPRVTYAASTGTLTITFYDTTNTTNLAKDPLDDSVCHWIAVFARANSLGAGSITIA